MNPLQHTRFSNISGIPIPINILKLALFEYYIGRNGVYDFCVLPKSI